MAWAKKSRGHDPLAESLRAKQRFQEALLINVDPASRKRAFLPINRLLAALFGKTAAERRSA